MSDPKMEKLAQLLASNPRLQKAALSGMAAALTKELKASGLDKDIDPAAIASLGKMHAEVGKGDAVSENFVARGVSGVFVIVKMGVEDLAKELTRVAKMQNKTDVATKALQKGGMIK